MKSNTNWEKLTAETMARIREAGYTEGGTLWLCIPNKHSGASGVVQGDYVGATFDRKDNSVRDAFYTGHGQHVWAENVSHIMEFQIPAAPDLD